MKQALLYILRHLPASYPNLSYLGKVKYWIWVQITSLSMTTGHGLGQALGVLVFWDIWEAAAVRDKLYLWVRAAGLSLGGLL